MSDKAQATIDGDFLTRVHVLLLDIKSMQSTLQSQVSRLAMAMDSRELELKTLSATIAQWGSLVEHLQAQVAFNHDDDLT